MRAFGEVRLFSDLTPADEAAMLAAAAARGREFRAARADATRAVVGGLALADE
jgi:hypothetical protein